MLPSSGQFWDFIACCEDTLKLQISIVTEISTKLCIWLQTVAYYLRIVAASPGQYLGYHRILVLGTNADVYNRKSRSSYVGGEETIYLRKSPIEMSKVGDSPVFPAGYKRTKWHLDRNLVFCLFVFASISEILIQSVFLGFLQSGLLNVLWQFGEHFIQRVVLLTVG